MEEQLEKVREDANILTNPRFSDESDDSIHEATKQVVDSVTKSMAELNATHQQLMTMCQQKRDLFIVCVKFHMTTRQVGTMYIRRLGGKMGKWVKCVCRCGKMA